MEYSVGSLSDLITGSKTPNKPKVIKREFIKEHVTATPQSKKHVKNEIMENEWQISPQNIDSPKKLKKKNKKERQLEQDSTLNIQSNAENIPRKLKRKSSISNETQTTSKKKKLNNASSHTDANVSSTSDDTEIENSFTSTVKLSQNEQNAERRVKKKDIPKKIPPSPEELERTIFIGNVPIKTKRKALQQHFKKYGKIESVRIRGIPVADPNVSKKVAAIKKEFNPNRNSVVGYIKFVDKEDAIKAQKENGVLFNEHHLRVHVCNSTDKPDETKAIFVGNLSFACEEDELWTLFETCGPISYVRIIRDPRTGMGKGFAYVNFKDSDAVQLALEMENVKLRDRELRISLCNLSVAKKKKSINNKKISHPGKPKKRKNRGKNHQNNADKEPSLIENQKGINIKRGDFQGIKFTDKKKKNKINKGLLEKKRVVKKLAPKPKTPKKSKE